MKMKNDIENYELKIEINRKKIDSEKYDKEKILKDINKKNLLQKAKNLLSKI